MPNFRKFLLKVLDATRDLVSDTEPASALGRMSPPPSFVDTAISLLNARSREILPVNSEMALCASCHKEASAGHVGYGTSPMRVPMKIKPGERRMVVARPQCYAFKPDQVIIENGDRWTVHDIKIGNRSQFAQSGDIPGGVFAQGTSSPMISFETAQTAMDVAFDVTYTGGNQEGEQFRASVVGTTAN